MAKKGRGMNAAQVRAYVYRRAKKFGLDPDAVMAVAAQEGLGGGVGDAGTSFGPWQLHIGGALPQSVGNRGGRYAQQWAWSPVGIDYALRKMHEAGASGLSGAEAVQAIVHKFERPADPVSETQRAIAGLGRGVPTGGGPSYAGLGGAPAGATPSLGGGGRPDLASLLQFAAPTPTSINILQRLGGTASRVAESAQNPVLGGMPSSQQSPLGLGMDMMQPQVEPQAVLPQPGKAAANGLNAEFNARLQKLMEAVRKAGGELYIFSGARDAQRQAQLYQAALRKYGSESEARKWVAPPGKSMHDTHAAQSRGLGDGALASDLRGDLAMAHKLAPQFGLSFPLSNEAWHIELAGGRGK